MKTDSASRADFLKPSSQALAVSAVVIVGALASTATRFHSSIADRHRAWQFEMHEPAPGPVS